MDQEARIAALEHLMAALFRKFSGTLDANGSFESAKASIMGSNGPGGPDQKSEAMEALANLRSLI